MVLLKKWRKQSEMIRRVRKFKTVPVFSQLQIITDEVTVRELCSPLCFILHFVYCNNVLFLCSLHF